MESVVVDEKPGETAVRAAGGGSDNGARRQRMRSIAIAVALAAMAVLFYAATIVRLGGNVLNRPL